MNFTPTIHQDAYPSIDPTKADLAGKYVLITGASRGMGKAMAISYAKAGATGIALSARSSLDAVKTEVLEAAKAANRPAPTVLTIKCDAVSQSDVDAAADEIKRSFNGHLDILINNAAYLEKWVPVVDSDPDEWWKTFEVNVKGLYLTTRAFLPVLLQANGDKTVVQVSSIGAHITIRGASGYQTTKLAVLRFNNFLMEEYGEQGLLAYSIHPGSVLTALAQNVPEQYHELLSDKPELCGDTMVWLTRERREWLADRYVSVNWDMDELLGKKDEIVSKDLLKVRLRVE